MPAFLESSRGGAEKYYPTTPANQYCIYYTPSKGGEKNVTGGTTCTGQSYDHSRTSVYSKIGPLEPNMALILLPGDT